MKKTIVSAIAAAALAAPAMASSLTISFASDDGTTTVMTFDQASMTATVEGADGSFHGAALGVGVRLPLRRARGQT